jgi:hypothetical protein
MATHSHMSPAAIERGAMWVYQPCDIFISALEEDRKAMAFSQYKILGSCAS